MIAILSGLLAAPAHATGTCSATVVDDLTCSSTVTGQVTDSTTSELGGTTAGTYYTCGSPYAPLAQEEGEQIYSFTCQVDGDVTLLVSGMDCDLDMYILGESCDAYSECEDGSTQSRTTDDEVTFTCTAGTTYYVVIEGYGWTAGLRGSGACRSGEGNYTLSFDVSAGTGCPEDCDDSTDNDLDGDTDCDDSDCAGDPVCSCDNDADGYDSTTCGGSDCDDGDAGVNPGASETCDGEDDDCDGSVDEGVTNTYYRDADSDGYGTSATTTTGCSAPSGYVSNSTDCDDGDASISPGDPERCNDVDDDCDGSIDEGLATSTYYRDADSDGYGTSSSTISDCSAPSGYVSLSTDCDDTDRLQYPGASERCNGEDDDCDGTVDEGTSSSWYYADDDGDGYGDASTGVYTCSPSSGYVTNDDDCDDTSASVSPADRETCNSIDDDCDGTVDDGVTTTYYDDDDGDGYGDARDTTTGCSAPSGYVSNDDDCNDASASISPGDAETCNSVDDDCDGSIDEGVTVTYYDDDDADGYGDARDTTTGCSLPSGYSANDDDCDDTSASVSPADAETCNGVDDDCDGSTDEGLSGTWYADDDGDGYGDAADVTTTCTAASGYVSNDDDCDDTVATTYPGATERCNGVDDDCDGTIDDGTSSVTWYADTDGDGYGDASSTITECNPPDDYVTDSTDCDDTDELTYPGADEVPYDGVDQDCDGSDLTDVDGDGEPAAEAGGTDCADGDVDVYTGAPETADGVDEDCDGDVDDGTEWFDDDGDGYTEEGGDCDDADADDSPAGTETADGEDDDCDGVVDDGTSAYDDDGDGYTEDGGDCSDGDAAVSPGEDEAADNGVDDDCDGSVDDGAYDPDGDGYTEQAGDCEPDRADAYPGGVEEPDGVDNDCDGLVDEGTAAWDNDGDGASASDGDCDDGNTTVHPDASEIVDGVDNDCDGYVDEGTDDFDDDGDGYTENGGDCDDEDPTRHPGTETSADGVDDDCDGDVDEGLLDADGDGVSADEGDCDDTDGWVSPDLDEMCDAIDNDCDGDVDEGCDGADAAASKDPGGCGCGGGGAASLVTVLLAAGLARRRRVANPD
ncbi:MAG: putative metal-binding motif-containing protein [Myxococcota bacterium]